MQKRLEYGFSGYQGPPIPRATRSVRRRSVIPKKKGDEKNQMCAFDLLATVAGKLLLESDSSNSSADTSNNNIKEKSPLKNCFNKEDYNNVDSELISQPPPVININNNSSNKEARHGHGQDACSGPTASVITTSDSSVMVDSSRENKSVPLNNGAGNRNSVKFPLCKDHIPSGSNVKLGIKDDDENCSTGNKSALRPLVCKIDRRIRKSMASDLTIKDNTDLEDRKSGYKRERSIRDYPFKKRRLYGGFNNNYDNIDNHDEGICVSPGEAFSVKDSNTKDALFGPSPSPAPQSEESHVKLKIKSFRVPEFSVEMPETASLASLKRKVMETVTAIIGGGPHVGVVVQGKKIRDDSKTLLQTGITHNHKLDSLAFILEPNSNTSSQPSPPHHTPQPLPRAINNDMLQDQTGTNLSNLVESDHDSASSPPDPDMSSQERSGADLRALVPVTSMNAEALQMVPMRKSTKRSESAQRRIRRPFSVSEVEALVQAVEKLGTGRWRDVKLRAFDNAKHRTYVDLKDKWKTLVHTARISPQQRRGEPVPQELLDRVLLAHAYWSQQQAKQQFKQHSEACLLL